jgi:hypothetical protein
VSVGYLEPVTPGTLELGNPRDMRDRGPCEIQIMESLVYWLSPGLFSARAFHLRETALLIGDKEFSYLNKQQIEV